MPPFTNNMFESDLAEYYDLMHRHRDYPGEAQFADTLVRKICPGARRILDLCCGTGSHAVEMARRGYQVTAVDASDHMLEIARRKAGVAGVKVDFRCADATHLDGIGKFDAAYCLGYTFLYMTSHAEAARFLASAREALSPDGVFLLDFINGWCLVEEYPRDKTVFQAKEVTIFRFDQASLRKNDRVRHIEFYYFISRGDGAIETIFAEEDLRIWFDDEVQLLMQSCGFRNVTSLPGYSSADAQASGNVRGTVVVVGQSDPGCEESHKAMRTK